MDMAAEELQLPHKLTLNERSHLSMTGVTEVVGFDEESVVLHTALGVLEVQGENLKLKNFSPEGGQVIIDGLVTSLYYEQPRIKSGFWGRQRR
jgi:sporulation protein YabP